MSFNPDLQPGVINSNEQLPRTFRCSTRDGMRRSWSTNTLVIISDKTKSKISTAS